METDSKAREFYDRLMGHLDGLAKRGQELPEHLAIKALILAHSGYWDATILSSHPAARFSVRDLIARYNLHAFESQDLRFDADTLSGVLGLIDLRSRYGIIEEGGTWRVIEWRGVRLASSPLASWKQALGVVEHLYWAAKTPPKEEPAAILQTITGPPQCCEWIPGWESGISGPGHLLAEGNPPLRIAGQDMHVGAIQVRESPIGGPLVPVNPEFEGHVVALYTLFSDDMETTEIHGFPGRYLIYAHPYAAS